MLPPCDGLSLSGHKLLILCSLLTLMIIPAKLSYSLLGRLVSETLDLLLSLIRDLGSLENNAGVLGLLEDLALGILGSLRGNTLDVLDQLLDVLAVLH